MRPGYDPGVLISQNFIKVDQHLWAALQWGLCTNYEIQQMLEMPEEGGVCHEQHKQARKTEDLAVKKFFLLGAIALFEPTREYYRIKCPKEKFEPWLRNLTEKLSAFMMGAGKKGVGSCKCVRDTQYPTIVAFVAEMIACYVNL
jgi:hypothetical protein